MMFVAKISLLDTVGHSATFKFGGAQQTGGINWQAQSTIRKAKSAQRASSE